ncbi:Glyco_hydro_1 domain-containing protein [Cephalotus follicularis]|uniref:Glyco_hydro_1 domain-containing protein n=1 Tax=Cephalotus follicularis TaxID=3775 RepID=A0A1Q3CDJ2_CEPFO|nr:Glyco_hydro_1 domain-containing protein [Cephalotus follicularis]
MMIIQHPLLMYLIASSYLLASIEGLKPSHHHSASFNRSSFPSGFVFGASSSAYQYEGATNADGRGPSIWDIFVRAQREKISDNSTGDVADEFYYRYKEDIALMRDIGLDSFRFSISWSRILPNGTISGGVNQKGVDFYNFLIDELMSKGIEPFPGLFHWDTPQALEDEYGGFLSPKIVNDYRDYAGFCFKEFGDRVKYWVTMNEPNILSEYGYARGSYAPGRCSNYIGNCTEGNSATEPYMVTHNLILSHAAAVKLYREKHQASQKGLVGVTTDSMWLVPKFETIASRKATSRGLDFSYGWVLHPLTYGEYPKTMVELVGDRLPKFTQEQSKMLKGSLDFIGVNYYTARYADDSTSNSSNYPSYTTDSRVNETVEKNGVLIGQPTTASWLYIYPKGIREILLYIKREYNDPLIFVTENGMGDLNNRSLPISEALKDSLRIEYHHLHLSYLLQAIEDGVNVKGYFLWTFLDDFEWVSGYKLRFGINYVDFENGLNRYHKNSAYWFRNFLKKENVSTAFPLLLSDM